MSRAGTVAILIAATCASMSCTTTYDAYGRPVQSVDPATATAGVAAAGLLGYAVANNKNKDDDHHHHHYYNNGRPRGYYDRHGNWHRY